METDEFAVIIKNNINLPSLYKEKGSLSISSQPKGKLKAFVATSSSSQEWIVDFGATHHMGSSKDQFSSLE